MIPTNIAKIGTYVDLETIDCKGKMRTHSRHTTTPTCSRAKPQLAKLMLYLVILVVEPALAGPVNERLDSFVSQPADVVIASFGNPAIRTPSRISYTFYANPEGIQLGPPSPVDRFTLGNSGGRSNGIAPDTSTTHQPTTLPCLLDFALDTSANVESVSYRGPGCYEVVYSRTIVD